MTVSSESQGQIGTPFLTIVVAGRNAPGGDNGERAGCALRFNHQQLRAAGIDHAFTLVEWAPVPDRPTLADQILSAAPVLADVLTTYLVDPRYHEAYAQQAGAVLLEFVARNVGIRRAASPFILTMQPDIFLGCGIVEMLQERVIDPGTVYRAARVDLHAGVDLTHVDWPLLEDVRNHAAAAVSRPLTPPLYAEGAADFLLLDRESFHRVGGFNEVYRAATDRLAGNFCAKAYANGYPLADIGDAVYRRQHGTDRQASPDAAAETDAGTAWHWHVSYENHDDWGLARATARPLDAHRYWLDFSWDAVPPLVDLKRVLIPGARGAVDLWAS